jgi:hypothetical protein
MVIDQKRRQKMQKELSHAMKAVHILRRIHICTEKTLRSLACVFTEEMKDRLPSLTEKVFGMSEHEGCTLCRNV